MIALMTLSDSAALPAASAVSSIPQLANVMDTDTTVVQIIGGLLVIVLLILAIAAVFRHLGFSGITRSGSMKIKSCLALSSKEKLVLVEVEGEQLLIGVSPGCVSHVKTLRPPSAVLQDPEAATTESTFSQRLMNALKQQNTQ